MRNRRGPLLWLAARSRRFWIGTAVMVPVIYLLSVPPLDAYIWYGSRRTSVHALVFIAEYRRPYYWLMNCAPEPVSRALGSYLHCWIRLVNPEIEIVPANS